MFYVERTNQYLTEGVAFTLDGINYANTWLNTSTPEEKTALDIVDVIIVGNRADDRYYWVSESLNGATLTFTNTPKDLDEVKKNATTQINQEAYSLLSQSDWMVIKALETATEIPVTWKTWRATIRSQANAAKTAINSASDVDQVASAVQVDWAKDPNTIVPPSTV